MTTRILWYLKHIDGRFPWHPDGRYQFDHNDLIRTTQLIDRRGFYGALHGTSSSDPLVTVASLIGFTERLRFLIPIYPGLTTPRLLAQQALAFDQLSKGRLLINLVNGQDGQLSAYGFHVAHDDRYKLSEDYWRLFTEFYEGRPGVYDGTYLDSRDKSGKSTQIGAPIQTDAAYGIPYGPFQNPHVPLWGAGASDAGQDHAGAVVEVYLAFLRNFDAVKSQIVSAHAAAQRHGRTFQGAGIHGSVTVRRTTRQARDAFYETYDVVGAERFAENVNRRIKALTGGQQDLYSFTAPDAQRQGWIEAFRNKQLPTLEQLEIEPGVFAGLTEFGGIPDVFGKGGAIYLVGSGEDVATQIRRYKNEIPGVNSFIFSGWPLAQEAAYVADYLFPHIDDLEQ